MAIKERKQITGTTEQINAYAGHEGQIVWDKEKKTFVGMSGTAGNNYPLAPKEYVDNEVAKFLPLSGGKLTGSLIVKGSAYNGKVAGICTDDQTTELMIVAGDVDWTKGGGALALYSKNHQNQGGFSLLGVGADGKVHTLSAVPSDWKLKWEGKEVERVNAIGENYIRYESGLQICWGRVEIPSGQINAIVTLPVPYKDSGSYKANGSYPDVYNTTVAATIAIAHNTYFQVALTSVQGKYDWYRGVDWTAIGRWK